jgi:hypothetical protein
MSHSQALLIYLNPPNISIMPTPIMSGNIGLQGYVAKRYKELHAQGYSKSEAHSIAFQELRELQAQQQAQPEPENPYNSIIYSDDPGF